MKTLRQMAGLAVPTSLDPAHTALLVIDFQREYFDGKLPLAEAAPALVAASWLVKPADRLDVTVIHVHHVAASPSAALFAAGSSGVEPVRGLEPAAHHQRVVKRLPSSFAGTDLAQRLRDKGCDTVIVCGLMTHNCVDATARDAMHLGFTVIVAADACASRDLPGAAGAPPLPARQVHEAVLAGLADRIADVLGAVQILSLFDPSARHGQPLSPGAKPPPSLIPLRP